MTDQNSQFFAILTDIGRAKQANATALGTTWTFAQMAVGDANGTEPIPNSSQTKLINERRRAPLNQVKVDPANANVIIAEQIIPESVGGWWVRELGLYDAAGDLVAVANCAPTFKPLLAQGSGRTQVIRINLIVSNTANIELKIDPSVVLATREYVDLAVTEVMSRLDFKHSVLVATTANIVLIGIQTVDGVLLAADSRVLVKDQAQAKDNGIYVVPAAGAWKRAQDADASVEVTPGLFVTVEKGTANGDSVWQLVTDAPIVLGTTALTFEVVAGRTGIVAGTYRSLTVDKIGRVIAGTNPNTLGGYGIANAYTMEQVDAALLGKAAKATTLEGYGIADAILATPKTGVVGKIGDITKHHIGVYASGTTDGMTNSSGGLFLRMKYPGDTPAAFDIFGHVGNGYDILGFRRVLADGSFTYRTVFHDGNFDPATKMPVSGGAYSPSFFSLRITTNSLPINNPGAFVSYGTDGQFTNAFNSVCNRSSGTGGFTWRTVNADNSVTGPTMSYSYEGRLNVPGSISTPAITGNTTVWDQPEGYAGANIANCAFVATAVGRKVSGDRSDVAGFYNGVKTAPYIRHTDGTVVYLQVDRPKDIALLTANGWSKNADTGEIIQRAEVAIGDSVGSMLVSVTWPFQFPSKCLRAVPSLRAANGSPISIIPGFYDITATGATVKFEELNSAVQSGLVLMVEAVGY